MIAQHFFQPWNAGSSLPCLTECQKEAYCECGRGDDAYKNSSFAFFLQGKGQNQNHRDTEYDGQDVMLPRIAHEADIVGDGTRKKRSRGGQDESSPYILLLCKKCEHTARKRQKGNHQPVAVVAPDGIPTEKGFRKKDKRLADQEKDKTF